MGEQRLQPNGGDEVGVRGREPAQGVGQFAGEAAGVGGQVEVDQHLLQAVAGDGAQHGQVRGGGAQGLVRSLALTVGVGGGGGGGGGVMRRRRSSSVRVGTTMRWSGARPSSIAWASGYSKIFLP